MIAVDTNLLVYAHRLDSRFNAPAYELIAELAAGADPWAIPWPCVYEFLSVVTHPEIFRSDPTPMTQAVAQVDAWRDSGNLVLPTEHAGTFGVLRDMLADRRVAGPIVHDAKIAAVCVSHEVDELWTADRDFGGFPTLRTRNPLVG